MKQNLLKILFVDDEMAVLRGLRLGYDWLALGFEVVGEALNAEDALALAEQNQVDVVITDICMDITNGLELLHKLKQLIPSPEVIILSGYPNFEYAQSAIEGGAFSYLLKPLRNSELFSTLDRLKASISSAAQKSRSLFFSHLLRLSQPSSDEICSLAAAYNVSLPKSDYFLCVFQISPSLPSGTASVYTQLSDRIKSCFSSYSDYLLCLKDRSSHLVALFFCPSSHRKTILCSQLDTIRADYSRQFEEPLIIAVSQLYSDLASIHNAYWESLQSIQHLDGSIPDGLNHSIVHSTDKDSMDVLSFLENDQLSELVAGIKTFNHSLVFDVLKNFFIEVRASAYTNPELVKNSIVSLAMSIINALSLSREQMKMTFSRLPTPYADVSSLCNLDEMERYLYTLVESIFSHAEYLNVNSAYSPITKKAITYIYLNYRDSISLDSIADELHVSKNYLMRVFKQDTGCSVNVFLTKHRIRIACTYLTSTDLSFAEIGNHVGYSDPSYFSKVFKNETGLLPSKYLKQQRSEGGN